MISPIQVLYIGFGQFFEMSAGEVFVRVTDAGIQTCYIFSKLDQVFQLRTTAGQDDAAVQYLLSRPTCLR